MNQRRFLAVTGLALAAPTIILAGALGREEKAAPSERVTMGVVGWGMQGPGNTGEFLRLKDCQVVAACDLDKNHLQAAVGTINGHYQNQDCKAYHDFRHHSAIPGHLGLISLLTGHDENGQRIGRKLKWDAEKEVILDDPEASKLLARFFRSPWKLG